MPLKMLDVFEEFYRPMIDHQLSMGLKKIGFWAIRTNTAFVDKITSYFEGLGWEVSIRHSKSRVAFFELSGKDDEAEAVQDETESESGDEEAEQEE